MFPHSRKYGTYFFQDQSGSYYFRIVTPSPLRKIYPNIQKEYRRSLYTANKRIAKSVAISLYMQMTKKFNDLVKGASTFDQIISSIPAFLHFNSSLSDLKKAELKGTYSQIVKANSALLENHYLEDITEKQSDLLELIKSTVDMLVEQCEYDNSELLIIDQTLEGLESLTAKFIRRIDRDSKKAFSRNLSQDDSIIHHNQEPDSNSDSQQRFADVSESFLNEMLETQIINNKTSDAYRATFNLFEKVTEISLIQDMNHTICRSFKEKVQKLPARLNSTPKLKALPLEQLFELKTQKISKETVNKHIFRIGTLLKWCIGQGHLATNFMEGKALKVKKKKESEKTLPFTPSELNMLFSTKIHLENKFLHSYWFWLPLISLYSGARIQEICQLELTDVRLIGSVLVFDINEDSDLKRLKNEFSTRLVPVHPRLIELGLLREIERLARLGKKYLFSELHKETGNRDGQSTSASKWFGRLKKKMDFQDKDKKVFHSFRHTFTDHLRKKEVPEHVTAALLGHHHSQFTYGVYGGTMNVEIELYPTILKVNYEGLDLDGVKWKAG